MTTKPTQFNANPLLISEIFKEFSNLQIPHYQRGFSWGESMDTLLSDIEDAISQNTEEYFVGPMTLCESEDSKDDEVYEVIDGQQRLTAFSLIICYLSNKLLKSDNPESRKGSVLEIIFQDPSTKKKPILQHQRIDDKKCYENILGVEKHNLSQSRMSSAHKIIEQKLGKLDDEETQEFLNYICSNIRSIVIVCKDDTIAYQIFETLNHRGQSLTPIDLIRNRIYSKAKKSDLDGMIKIWDETYGRLKDFSNGISAERHFQQLFGIYLNISHNKWIEDKSLFRELKDEINNQSVKKLLNEICSDQSIRSYLRLQSPNSTFSGGNDEIRRVLAECGRRFKVAWALCYAMFYREISPLNFIQVVGSVKALMSRTRALGYNIPVMKYGQLLTEIAHKVYKGKSGYTDKEIVEKVAKDILNIDSKNRNVFNDESFIERLSSLPFIKPEIAKEIFEDIYNTNKDTQGLNITSDLHLEHILPKTYTQKGWSYWKKEEHKDNCDRLGNMLILDGKTNQQLNQGSFANKINAYKKSEFYNTAGFLQEFEEQSEWDKESIIKRQKIIATTLTKVWNLKR